MGFQDNAFQDNAFQGAEGGGPAPEIDPSRMRLLAGVGRAIVFGIFLRLFIVANWLRTNV